MISNTDAGYVGAFVAGMLPGVVGYVSEMQRRRRAERRAVGKDDIPDEIKEARDAQIYAAMGVMRERLGACGLYYLRRHNGGNYDDGESIDRLSAAYPLPAPGKPNCYPQTHKGMLVSSIPTAMRLARTPGPSWTLVCDLEGADFFRIHCEQFRLTSVALCAVYLPVSNRPDGFLQASFDDGNSSPPAHINELCECAKRIRDEIFNALSYARKPMKRDEWRSSSKP